MLLERFKLDKRIYDSEHCKTELETQLCTNDDHSIAKMCELLLKFETEAEQVIEF